MNWQEKCHRTSECSVNHALKLMNKCHLLSWDGYHGKVIKYI